MNHMSCASDQPCVLHIHFWADIRNDAGSVEKVITSFAAHGQSFTHAIACCPAAGKIEPPFEYQGVRIFPFTENQIFNRLVNKMLGMRRFSYFSLVRLIKRLRPRVLHFHNRQELVDPLMRRLDYRPAVFVHYHRDFTHPVIPRSADHLLFVSEATRKHILAKHPITPKQSATVLFNPLSLEVLQRAQQSACGRVQADRHDQPNRPPIILFGGGGAAIKGGAELLSAFSMLPTGSARLLLAGHQVERLLQAPLPGVELLGRVSAQEFFDLMVQADIVTMPSYEEPFGLIAQEAMLLRRLLLVSNNGGLAEFTGPDSAVQVAPKNVEALHQALCRALSILQHPAQHEAFLDCAATQVKRFHPAALTADLEARYTQQLNAGSQKRCD